MWVGRRQRLARSLGGCDEWTRVAQGKVNAWGYEWVGGWSDVWLAGWLGPAGLCQGGVGCGLEERLGGVGRYLVGWAAAGLGQGGGRVDWWELSWLVSSG